LKYLYYFIILFHLFNCASSVNDEVDINLRKCIDDYISQSQVDPKTALFCNSADIRSLKGIESFQEISQIEFLDLSGNEIEDYAPLKSLDKLAKLKIQNNNANNYFGLSSLTNIGILEVTIKNSTNMEEIVSLDNIYNLSIVDSYLDFESMNILKGAKYLSGLWLIRSNFSYFPDLENSEKFEEIGLDQSSAVNYSNLVTLTNLKYLHLYEIATFDIELVKELSNIKHLHIRDIYVSNYEVLENLINIEALIINNTLLSNVQFLSKLVNLKLLNLSNNRISSGIDSISDLVHLETLYLDHNSQIDCEKINQLKGVLTNTGINEPEHC